MIKLKEAQEILIAGRIKLIEKEIEKAASNGQTEVDFDVIFNGDFLSFTKDEIKIIEDHGFKVLKNKNVIIIPLEG